MAISGHKNEASIRSYSSSVSEDQSRNMSDALAIPTTENSAQSAVYQGNKECYVSPEGFSVLKDCDIPSSPQLNQVMNTVLSPVLSTSKDVFRYNRFDGCTINISYNS